mmetsp:Transcript_26907/g.57030  ORF Transcript_26907/g.57030 Transcript_26907/m.57030 type:complete len:202 (+) Transcript_26907:541-1146(+)
MRSSASRRANCTAPARRFPSSSFSATSRRTFSIITSKAPILRSRKFSASTRISVAESCCGSTLGSTCSSSTSWAASCTTSISSTSIFSSASSCARLGGRSGSCSGGNQGSGFGALGGKGDLGCPSEEKAEWNGVVSEVTTSSVWKSMSESRRMYFNRESTRIADSSGISCCDAIWAAWKHSARDSASGSSDAWATLMTATS